MLKLLAFVLLTSPALAQEYTPPDKELWMQMVQALSQVSMPLSSHQAVQQIVQSVEREAAARAVRSKSNAK